MFKNAITVTAFCFGLAFVVPQDAHAQKKQKTEKSSKKDKKAKKDKKGKESKVLVRPASSGVSAVDGFTGKSFDSYEESLSISKAIEFIKVETKEIPDAGDGVTSETVISNGNGEAVTKRNAVLQFGELLVRAKLQSDNIQAIQKLQQPATDAIKTCAPATKPKASKSLTKGSKALTFVIAETKTQLKLIGQQISTLKAIKNN